MDVQEKVSTGGTPQQGGQISGGAGAEQGAGVPKGLERFAGQDGKLDLNKLGQSYLELEKGFHGTRKELSALQRAYEALGPKVGTPVVDPEEERGKEFSRLVEDPKGYTESVATASMAGQARAVKAAILELAHPELKDAEFKKGLQEFAATLPPGIQQSLDDYNTADWVVKFYKQQKNPGSSAGSDNGGGAPILGLESASSSPTKTGKTWKRSEIRKMQANEAEYAKHADEIAKAYEEGRVLKDQ